MPLGMFTLSKLSDTTLLSKSKLLNKLFVNIDTLNIIASVWEPEVDTYSEITVQIFNRPHDPTSLKEILSKNMIFVNF